MKTNLGLAMIVKDDSEVKQLERCLDSIKDYVDHIYLVGNNHPQLKVKLLVEKLNKETPEKVKWYWKKWDWHFGEMRNFSFSKVKDKVTLWLDTDDIVDRPKKIQRYVDIIVQNRVSWVGVNYNYNRQYGLRTSDHMKYRILKTGSGKWVGSIHENLVATEPVKMFNPEDFEIIHEVGDFVEHTLKHNDRNTEILMKEYERDGESTDPRTLAYLGRAMMTAMKFDDAVFFYSKFVNKTGWDEEKYFALTDLGVAAFMKGKDDEAERTFLEAIRIFPQWSLAYLRLGIMNYELGKFRKAIEFLNTGFTKERPTTVLMINDIDNFFKPLQMLAMSYFQLGKYQEAREVGDRIVAMAPEAPEAKTIYEIVSEAEKLDDFVKAFINVVDTTSKYDRIKSLKMFDLLPKNFDEDIRIQQLRHILVPPTVWKEGTVVIYCGSSIEPWAYPSIYKGIGGSEEMVIRISQELVKLGYDVTVYNRCGEMRGEYFGVKYLPYYYCNPNDHFDTFISWRDQMIFDDIQIKANRKYLWLHDISYPEQFNKNIIDNIDRFFFLSKWHRGNLPDVPEEKVFITNNGINPDDFKTIPEKKPYSMIWQSSYDRGLLPFLQNIWPIIKNEIPEATLDVMYGWNNIDKELELIPSLKILKRDLVPLLENTEGVAHHGRVNHSEVAKFTKQAVCMPYASEFGETNFIGSMKAQVSGCYVIMPKDAGGAPERVRFGKVLDGEKIYTNKELQKEYAEEVIKYLKNPIILDESHRQELIQEFSVGTTAKEWDKLIKSK